MKSLWFIMPAYRRFELSAICFAQRARLCQELHAIGVDANVCVIADDENLELAQEHGFATVERENRLGAKLNDGYQFAASQGVDYVCQTGSDEWVDPKRFAVLPEGRQMLCTRNYSAINRQGTRRAHMRIAYDGGVGVRAFKTSLLAYCGFRPLTDDRAKGCDTATLRAILYGGRVEFVYTDLHPLEVVGFQSDLQLTSYERLSVYLVKERKQPFAGLAKHYPADLVAKVKELYKREPLMFAAREPLLEGI